MRSSKTFVLALCLSAFAAGPALAGSVRGTVRDASTLDAIAEALVTVYVVKPDSVEISTLSDDAGAYLLAGVPAGNDIYWLVCQKGGYSVYYARLQDPGSSEVVFDILMETELPPPPPGDPDSSSVSGSVLEWGSLFPLENASVRLNAGGNEYIAHTDAEGRYAVYVSPGVYTVMVEAAGHEPVSDSGIEAGAVGCTYNALLKASLVSVPADGGGRNAIVLRGAWPNPFLRATAIRFWLREPGTVELRVYDVLGREVRSLAAGWMDAGSHAIPFTADGLPAGTYFCHVKVGGRMAVAAMTSLR